MKRADVGTVLHCGKPARFRPEPSGSIHYGRAECRVCGRYIAWVPFPRPGEELPEQVAPEPDQEDLFEEVSP